MDITPPEARRVMVLTGTLPSPKLQHLAASHPFTQQLDVVFPASTTLEDALSKLETRYMRGRVQLSYIMEHARLFDAQSNICSDLMMMSTGTRAQALDPEDTWCIDQRGLLTLSVRKETYECLGLVGTKLPFKHAPEQYVIRIPLREHAESAHTWSKQKSALKAWDARRDRDGLGSWEVLYCRSNSDAALNFDSGEDEVHQVGCRVQHLSDVHIPIPTITPPPTEGEAIQKWNTEVASLFEWVGMACLGAQRLKANDNVDPYVAVYELEPPSRLGNVTHLQWRGFLPPSFVQSVLDTAMSSDSTSTFISITSHSYPASPVSYIPPAAFLPSIGKSKEPEPTKVPRDNAESTWSLILVLEEPGDSESTSGRWMKVASNGQWDTQLG